MLPNTTGDKPFHFTRDQLEKTGNTLVYLLQHDPQMDRTKILHSLFLIEEASWKKYSHPFFDMPFQLWKAGPVAKDIYIDLSEENPVLWSAYLKHSAVNANAFVPLVDFNDDQFSENDLEMLETVTRFTMHQTARELTLMNTGRHSLWYRTALPHDIFRLFKSGQLHSTDLTIDFRLLFTEEAALAMYYSVKENSDFINQLKR